MPFECKQKVDKFGIEYYFHLAWNISYPLRALSLPLSLYVVLFLNLCNLMLLFYRIISLVLSLTIESLIFKPYRLLSFSQIVLGLLFPCLGPGAEASHMSAWVNDRLLKLKFIDWNLIQESWGVLKSALAWSGLKTRYFFKLEIERFARNFVTSIFDFNDVEVCTWEK